jgi:DNA repair protein RecN (Recombination protein N)
MLLQLSISNYALIDHLTIEFDKGMNILTGETGAGKSIILNALALLCGGKYDSTSARDENKSVIVQALFEVDKQSPFYDFIQESGMGDSDEECLLKREIQPNGRNRCWLNSNMLRVGDLKKLSPYILNVHSQHQTHQLLDASYHAEFLAQFAGKSYNETLATYTDIYHEWLGLRKKKNSLEERQREIQRQIERLEQEVEEIGAVSLIEDEEETLEKKHHRLVHQQEIEAKLEWIQQIFDASEEGTAGYQLACLGKEMEELAQLDDNAQESREAFETFSEAMASYRECLIDYESSRMKDEQDSLQEIEERMAEIEALKRKYGKDIPEILQYEKNAAEQLFKLHKESSDLENIDERLLELSSKVLKVTEELTHIKKEAARNLQQEINLVLNDLNMEEAGFLVCFPDPENGYALEYEEKHFILGPQGCESVEFFIRSNKGQDYRPLVKTASGGEVSRVMLAMKKCFADIHPVQTFIFDEIDTGVGGETAHCIAKVLGDISERKQSIVITHLAQIAIKASRHFRVEKYEKDGQTFSRVICVAESDKESEIARMMGLGGMSEVHGKNFSSLLG